MLTLHDLHILCDRYVPWIARIEASRTYMNQRPPHNSEWWWAHEIGHLLTVPIKNINVPLFGMGGKINRHNKHEFQCRELAAMSISRRLLCAIGRRDLAIRERNETVAATLHYDDRGRVQEILQEHACLRLPLDRHRLEMKLKNLIRMSSEC